MSPRTLSIRIACTFYRWKLGADVMKGRIKIKPKDWVLLSWHWSVNFINNKNSAILSLKLILLILTFLEKPWQSICSCICLVLAIINSKIVLKELLGPMDLSGAQTLCIHEMTKVIVVHKNKELIFTAFQVVAPYLEGFDNSQKLTVVGLVLCFCWNYFPWKERY